MILVIIMPVVDGTYGRSDGRTRVPLALQEVVVVPSISGHMGRRVIHDWKKTLTLVVDYGMLLVGSRGRFQTWLKSPMTSDELYTIIHN